jgi:hypothetical protein
MTQFPQTLPQQAAIVQYLAYLAYLAVATLITN